MKVIRKDEKDYVKFSQLKPGDTFIDPENSEPDPEMKIEYGDIDFEFSETGEPEPGFASVSLTTGNVFFYKEKDFYVIPIKFNAVEE